MGKRGSVLKWNTGNEDRYAVENGNQVSVLPHGRTLILVMGEYHVC